MSERDEMELAWWRHLRCRFGEGFPRTHQPLYGIRLKLMVDDPERGLIPYEEVSK